LFPKATWASAERKRRRPLCANMILPTTMPSIVSTANETVETSEINETHFFKVQRISQLACAKKDKSRQYPKSVTFPHIFSKWDTLRDVQFLSELEDAEGRAAALAKLTIFDHAEDVRIRTVQSQDRALAKKRETHSGFLLVTIQITCVPASQIGS
jgi:hypothetical protein